MEFVKILTTDVRYFFEVKIHDTEREGRAMERREGVWASLIKDTRYNNNVRDGENTCNSGTDNEVRGGKDTCNNNDVRGGNDTSNNDVRVKKWSHLREDVTMLSFNDCDIASKVCEFYKDLDYPSIPKVIAKVDDTTVVVKKIPQVPIMEWLKSRQEERMWTVDSTKTKCLELEGRYSNIFRYKYPWPLPYSFTCSTFFIFFILMFLRILPVVHFFYFFILMFLWILFCSGALLRR